MWPIDWAKAVFWAPTAAAAAMAVVAVVIAIAVPERWARRRIGLAIAVVFGALAVAAAAWQQQRGELGRRQQQAEAAARSVELGRDRDAGIAKTIAGLKALKELLDAVGHELPAAGQAPDGSFDTVDGGFAALGAEIDALGKQIAAFREASHSRAIDDATAAGMAAYLRPLGPYRIVVSCVSADLEAFNYANRVASILRQAGWGAVGPETTSIFGTAPAMGIAIYVRARESPAPVRVLMDAFTRFNIPFQSRIAWNGAIPDGETVELFVAKKP